MLASVSDEDEKSAQILISKIAAARRQLDAAIRMTFAGEDELAIYTVAAAAQRVLRDIMHKRGRSALAEGWLDMLVGLAHALAKGQMMPSLRDSLQRDAPDMYVALKELAETIAVKIAAGETWAARDVLARVQFSPDFEPGHWAMRNRPANFLKHADTDADALWK